ncbi:MAG: phosphoribosylanthranilate isomerase [Cytophagaceae bacterium]
MIKLKVCGMKYEDNAQAIADMLPDYMGFIFYKPSKRFCGETIRPSFTKGLVPSITPTGVFVNEEISVMDEYIDQYGLKAVQLHGDESVDVCQYYQKTGLEVIKVFSVGDIIDWKQVAAYENVCDYFLFDTQTAGYGGSGKAFSHQLLANYPLSKPYFLSGGIDLEIWKEKSVLALPGLYAFDINSKFEIEPGKKDLEKVQQFNQLRKQFNGFKKYIG